jgi:hypothetical protein
MARYKITVIFDVHDQVNDKQSMRQWRVSTVQH